MTFSFLHITELLSIKNTGRFLCADCSWHVQMKWTNTVLTLYHSEMFYKVIYKELFFSRWRRLNTVVWQDISEESSTTNPGNRKTPKNMMPPVKHNGGSGIMWKFFTALGPEQLGITARVINTALCQRKACLFMLKLKHNWVMQQENDQKCIRKTTYKWRKNNKSKGLIL